MDPQQPKPEAAPCPSCGQPRSGRFCSQCGEESLDHHDLSIRHFIAHTVLHEFTHVDGKIGNTIRNLLFRPGFLTCEYFAGRRTLYLNPLRVLLTAAILFALLAPVGKISIDIRPGRSGQSDRTIHLSMLPPTMPESENLQESVKKLDIMNVLSSELENVQRTRDTEDRAVFERFNRRMESYGEILSFCSVIPLTLVLWLIYRRSRPYLVEHLVFSLHMEAFFLLLAIAAYSLLKLPVEHSPRPLQVAVGITAIFAAYLIQAWYLHNALMRFYHPEAFAKRYHITSGVAWRTAFAGLVLFSANSLFLSVVHTIGAAIALWRL